VNAVLFVETGVDWLAVNEILAGVGQSAAALVVKVTSAGSAKIGTVTSFTVTTELQVAVLPAGSETVRVTTLAPILLQLKLELLREYELTATLSVEPPSISLSRMVAELLPSRLTDTSWQVATGGTGSVHLNSHHSIAGAGVARSICNLDSNGIYDRDWSGYHASGCFSSARAAAGSQYSGVSIVGKGNIPRLVAKVGNNQYIVAG
jgi:hypothetical protein